MQLLQHMQRMLWLLALLACADGRLVGDHAAQETSELQRLQQRQRLLRLVAHLACGDGSAVGDHLGHKAWARHYLETV